MFQSGEQTQESRDDLNQRLSFLANELEWFAETCRTIRESPRSAHERLRQLQTIVDEISVGLHTLSHDLHCFILEYTGLAPAVRSYCAEIAKQCQIQIEVHLNISGTLPQGTALCLFLILEEGLSNVIRHSRASKVDVLLEGGVEAVTLSIYDNGVGFEPSNGPASRGTGIFSMREWARILGGSFDVLTRPAQGTLVSIRVPIDSAMTR